MDHIIREPLSVYGKTRFTEQEYLDWSEKQEGLYEYRQGEIFAIQGESARHEGICFNMLYHLGAALRGKPCRPFGSKFRLKVAADELITYPDITVICGKEPRVKVKKELINEPVILAEVLSPSTRNYDRGDKFSAYQKIPSLQQFLAVESTVAKVYSYLRDENDQWTQHIYTQLDDSIKLNSIGIELSLEDVYEDIELDNRLVLSRV